MRKRISFMLLLMSCSLCLCFMSSTYSRYVAGTTGNIDILFAKWQILINNEDITNQNNSSITINPTIEVLTPCIGVGPLSNSSTYTPGDKYSGITNQLLPFS